GMVTSAHKTLASFTQGAYLFSRAGALDSGRLGEAFELLNTTSVAAAILASLDRTRRLMALRGGELLAETLRLAGEFREALRGVLCGEGDRPRRASRRAHRGGDDRPLPAGHPCDRPGGGHPSAASGGAPRGRRGRHPDCLLRGFDACHRPGRRPRVESAFPPG